MIVRLKNKYEIKSMKIINSKKAVGPIGAIMLFMFFIIIWFIWLGGWVAYVGHDVVVSNNLVGVEAFFFDNLNFVIMIVIILAMIGWQYFGAQQ